MPIRRFAIAVIALPALSCARCDDTTPPVEIVQIAAGHDLTCARSKLGEIYRWGDNAFDGSEPLPPPSRKTPVKVAGVTNAVAMDVASGIGCAVLASGDLACWRDAAFFAKYPAPPLVAYVTDVHDVVDVSLSPAITPNVCVLKKDRTVACAFVDWGEFPAHFQQVKGLANVEAMATGDRMAGAIMGGNLHWYYGGGFRNAEDAPWRPLIKGAKQLSASSSVMCAIDASGKAIYVLGDRGPIPDRPATLVRVGGSHVCIIDTSGRVECWGDDEYGQSTGSIASASDIAVGQLHTCALETTGKVWCWGRNQRGQLGDGTTKSRSEAKPVVWR